MINKEKKSARSYDSPNRARFFTDKVYSGKSDNKLNLIQEVYGSVKSLYPNPPEYKVFYGDLHGHSNLSDGIPDIDDYFKNMKDMGFDFCALTDHDHGGIGNDVLLGEKWDLIKKKVKEYNIPNEFTTILGYERDSYPYYNNMIIYYDNYDGEMITDEKTGEITREKLLSTLKRDDVLVIPHDTYSLGSGADLRNMDKDLFTPLIEIYSRGDCAEYFNNPYNITEEQCRNGFWQEALKRGAKMGCIAASDDHRLQNGKISNLYDGIKRFPGITGVLAKENNLKSIFEALKQRRCYGFMGGRMEIDFRINGHYMGEEFECSDTREIYFNVKADNDIEKITVVKNCEDWIILKYSEKLIYDYKPENETDVYYLRVELKDGRCGWTSPIWITR